jgi:2-methylisocitrate lyase-like PEP mutase family enzyme
MTAEKAGHFRSLHHGTGVLLVANAWDVITARVLEDCGFPAVGTTSFGIARAHGFRDGENAALDVTLAMVRRMAAALTVPLTVDMEGGYGDSPRAVEEHAVRFIEAGAVGFNVEDGRSDPAAPLGDPERHAETVAALREASRRTGVPVFVNARTDVLWLGIGRGDAALDHALRRAEIYVAAGADGIFIPGLSAADQIAQAVRGVPRPLNVLASPAAPAVPALAALGVKRLSLGSGPVRACLGVLRGIGRELLGPGTYRYLKDAMPYDEANRI